MAKNIKQTSLDNLINGEDVTLDDETGLTPLRASSLTTNFGGTRLLYGGSDGELRCVDFYKWMSGGYGPLWSKNLDQSITAVAMNHDNSVAAAAIGSVISFYSDAGEHMFNTTKGDMYLLDPRKTRGHTATVTCLSADPDENNIFTSGSIDGTLRNFDINAPRQGVSMSIHAIQTFVPKAARGPRAQITALCFCTLKSKSIVVGATERGSLCTWDRRTAYPGVVNMEAHMSRIGAVLSPDDNMLISRCHDVVKLWDLRNPTKVVLECAVPGGDMCPNMAISPDGLHVAVGEVTPINPRNIKEGFKGCIKVVSAKTLSVDHQFKVKSPPGPIAWANELGQLFTICHDGKIWSRCNSDALESMYLSRAKAAVRHKATAAAQQTVSVQPEVFPIDQLPDNLEEAEDGTLKRKRLPRQYNKPGAKEEPDLDYVSYGRTPVSYEDEDIVTKLRAMEGDTNSVTAVATGTGIQRIPYKTDKFMRMYQKSQPELILDFTAPEGKEENMLIGVQKCPRCGIKICQCGYMDSRKS
ncbi:WD domain G-beta repeat family protein [Babesia bovis T2Bo]|uniref:Uncharacterized protein n=1 Tax=Babesia bovis TaxID=5865 RepID=A7ATD2_BABBO|nr:WD domain G-beta repeat family protein [Babesia bovis T2Bo]EDO06193.1 WD domain G-beta repeat family protein [Babesia bovis T2Bo]|eukprot:XP_001609761.1 hypothetical protein [Babesia bovis T2Bo]